MNQSRKMAACGVTAAVCVVILLLGGVIDIGMYAAPIIAGLLLISIGDVWGRKYQVMLWGVVSVLAFLFVPNLEENLMFAGLFGWYPILRPGLERLPRLLRWPVKLAMFNGAVLAIEALVMWLVAPAAEAGWILAVLLVMANGVFIMYDFLIPRVRAIFKRVKK